MEDTEASLSQEMTRHQRLNQEVALSKGEIEKLLTEKDAEIESIRWGVFGVFMGFF